VIKITNEDNMDLMSRYPDKYFDLAIVDPPYGIGYSNLSKRNHRNEVKYTPKSWDDNIPTDDYFNELFRVSKNQLIWGGNYFNLPISRFFVCWVKQPQSIKQSQCEYCWGSFDESAKYFKYFIGNESGFAPKSTDIDKQFSNIHPTQKPVKLYEWLLMNYAKEGYKILNTHLGSGSIAIAGHKLGFDLIACELDKDYYEAAMKRLKQHQAQMVLF